MPSDKAARIGLIEWTDITVADAEQLRDFYSAVVGWKWDDVSMGDYSDYAMKASEDAISPVAGICHAKGGNSHLPPQWLVYINVDNMDHSRQECVRLGGKLLSDVKVMPDYGKFCVIEDPAGAVAALFEPIDE